MVLDVIHQLRAPAVTISRNVVIWIENVYMHHKYAICDVFLAMVCLMPMIKNLHRIKYNIQRTLKLLYSNMTKQYIDDYEHPKFSFLLSQVHLSLCCHWNIALWLILKYVLFWNHLKTNLFENQVFLKNNTITE